MIKPARPGGARESLGWRRVDEPSPLQSDPTVLDMRLRALSKKSGLKPVPVRSIEHADKNARDISRWADSMAELHRTRPPPTIHYSRPMPHLEGLMQEWYPAFDEGTTVTW
jgi:intraflagellar transport protein 46